MTDTIRILSRICDPTTDSWLRRAPNGIVVGGLKCAAATDGALAVVLRYDFGVTPGAETIWRWGFADILATAPIGPVSHLDLAEWCGYPPRAKALTPPSRYDFGYDPGNLGGVTVNRRLLADGLAIVEQVEGIGRPLLFASAETSPPCVALVQPDRWWVVLAAMNPDAHAPEFDLKGAAA